MSFSVSVNSLSLFSISNNIFPPYRCLKDVKQCLLLWYKTLKLWCFDCNVKIGLMVECVDQCVKNITGSHFSPK